MGSLGSVAQVLLWIAGVPLIVFVVLRLIRYDFEKPSLIWRTKAGPLPLRVYAGVAAVIALGLVVAALLR